jgi:hypothetical protein
MSSDMDAGSIGGEAVWGTLGNTRENGKNPPHRWRTERAAGKSTGSRAAHSGSVIPVVVGRQTGAGVATERRSHPAWRVASLRARTSFGALNPLEGNEGTTTRPGTRGRAEVRASRTFS